MRRAILLAVAAGLGILAFGLPRPPAPEGPTFTGPTAVDPAGGAQASVWYCPRMSAGAVRDTWLALASIESAEIGVTMPSPIPNEEPDAAQLAMTGPGATVVEVASVVRRGDAPGFAEFSDGPSAAAAVVVSEGIEDDGMSVSGDRCVAAVPKLWHLPGATTRTGRFSTLRLFNPFPEPAKVTVSGASEFGDLGLLGVSSLDVDGRSWEDIDLNQQVSLLDDIALTVSSEDGLVIPSLLVSTSVEEASWPGTGLSTSWTFPIAVTDDLSGSVVVSNPGDSPLSVDIDVHTTDALLQAARTESVPAGRPLRIPLRDLADGAFGVVVRATAPVAAVVVAEDLAVTTAEDDPEAGAEDDAGRIAGTVGIETPSTRWLLPGVAAVPDSTATMWVLNPNSEEATVQVQPLGGAPIEPEEFTIGAGLLQPLPLRAIGVSGYLIEGSLPIAVSWSTELSGGIAFIDGTAIGE